MPIENTNLKTEKKVSPETQVARALKEIDQLFEDIQAAKNAFMKSDKITDYTNVVTLENKLREVLASIKSDPAQSFQLEKHPIFEGRKDVIDEGLGQTREWLNENKLNYTELAELKTNLSKKRDEFSKEYTEYKNSLSKALDELLKKDKITQDEYQEIFKKSDLSGDSTDIPARMFSISNEIESIVDIYPDLKIDINFDEDMKNIDSKRMEIQKKIIESL